MLPACAPLLSNSLSSDESVWSTVDFPDFFPSGLLSVLDPNVVANAPIGVNCDATATFDGTVYFDLHLIQ